MALLDRGITHLMSGINNDSGGPPFPRPTAFWWKMPDGRRMFVWLGEHYGAGQGYLKAARNGVRFRTDEQAVRAAHADFEKKMREMEAAGYVHERLILGFTNPLHIDNGSPFPTLAPFIAAWNRLGLQPALRLTTASDALFEMERAIGSRIPVQEGEWTDWWANGDASAPREVAASRAAKRSIAAAMSPVFGPMPQHTQPMVESILKDLCLFDEHTWGAARSISDPYTPQTLAHFVEKSDLAYRPMGRSEALMARRVRARIDSLPEGIYAINPTAAEMSGWAKLNTTTPPFRSLLDTATGHRAEIYTGGGSPRFWLEKMAPHSVRALRGDTAVVTDSSPSSPQIKLDTFGWPVAAAWPGMTKPLFDGAAGDFVCVAAVPPADRRTITELHANRDAEKRAEVRKASFRETAASYGSTAVQETAHTLMFTQEFRHERIAQASRTLELWKSQPRARVSVRFDRISSLAPEVLFLAFTLPEGSPLPVLSSGAVPFTPYRDQLGASCRDYYAIDGWAHYRSNDGHRLWVTRDAPLVAIGSPHVVERHQQEPADHRRILAMVFDNCWHTNFVADSHGTMEFQFDLVWKQDIERPADLAESLAAEPIVVVNPAVHETPPELNNLYRP
jgi:hypothetical protein